jgi:hypothetical protein
MHGSFGHYESLSCCELDRPPFEVDQKPPINDVKELVEIVVLVPVILALRWDKLSFWSEHMKLRAAPAT